MTNVLRFFYILVLGQHMSDDECWPGAASWLAGWLAGWLTGCLARQWLPWLPKTLSFGSGGSWPPFVEGFVCFCRVSVRLCVPFLFGFCPVSVRCCLVSTLEVHPGPREQAKRQRKTLNPQINKLGGSWGGISLSRARAAREEHPHTSTLWKGGAHPSERLLKTP